MLYRQKINVITSILNLALVFIIIITHYNYTETIEELTPNNTEVSLKSNLTARPDTNNIYVHWNIKAFYNVMCVCVYCVYKTKGSYNVMS